MSVSGAFVVENMGSENLRASHKGRNASMSSTIDVLVWIRYESGTVINLRSYTFLRRTTRLPSEAVSELETYSFRVAASENGRVLSSPS